MTERQRGEDGIREEQRVDGDRGERGERGPQGRKGVPGFDGECCVGLVRLMERCENNEEKIHREVIDRERMADDNKSSIIHEENERKVGDETIWKEIDSVKKEFSGMKNMALIQMLTAIFALLVFIGSIFAHALKIG